MGHDNSGTIQQKQLLNEDWNDTLGDPELKLMNQVLKQKITRLMYSECGQINVWHHLSEYAGDESSEQDTLKDIHTWKKQGIEEYNASAHVFWKGKTII